MHLKCTWIKFAILILLTPSLAWGACTGSSPLWTTTADRASVASCVSQASYGDTIQISACAPGACVWSSGITVTKDIKIVGSGGSSTYITNGQTWSSGNYLYLFKFEPDSTAVSRIDDLTTDTGIFEITGIHFYDTTPKVYVYPLLIYRPYAPVIKRIRVHHNAFTNFSYANKVLGYVHGLFDNNTLTNCDGGYPEGLDSGHWIYDIRTPGTAQAWYYEDNTFTPGPKYGGISGAANRGFSHVMRYNTINVGTAPVLYWETHCTGPQFTEFYGNKILATASQRPQLRGGIGFLFFNRLESPFRLRHEYSDPVTWNILHSGDIPPSSTACAGPTSYNPGTGTFPQICRDTLDGAPCTCNKVNHTYVWNNRNASGTIQGAYKADERYDDSYNVDAGQTNTGVGNINPPELVENREFFNHNEYYNGTTQRGVYCGSSLPAACTVGDGAWIPTNIETMPCSSVSANNIGVNPAVPITGTLYRCTATNRWTAWYTPFTYPHPLRSASIASTSTPPPPPPVTVATALVTTTTTPAIIPVKKTAPGLIKKIFNR